MSSGDPATATRFAEALGAKSHGSSLEDLVAALQSADALVYVLAPHGRVTTAIADGDSDRWRADCEDLAWQALAVLQAGHHTFAERGGHIVAVVPNIGISGCAGLVPYTAAIEATRAMVKSAARQWTEQGVVLSTAIVPLGAIWPDAPELVRLAAPAAGRTADLEEIAVVLDSLLELPPGATGATIIVDGGSVMAP